MLAGLPERYSSLAEYLLLLPDIAVLMSRLMRDSRVPLRSKAVLGLCLAYIVSPVDIILDIIPGLGSMDDLMVAFYALDSVLSAAPPEVLREHWSGKVDLLDAVRKVMRTTNHMLGSRIARRLKRLIKKPELR